ncbi:lipase family protein [Williamsia sp.]|uniref:lipase family protein n=1 Tax=Williamsia sp. TaxID=1872085 RepID=UPI001A33413C|nr:lipase family protein [Williamsia sp.]MBJ7289145.1 alpha/beta fold hydrolase [Williamsia sp.]
MNSRPRRAGSDAAAGTRGKRALRLFLALTTIAIAVVSCATAPPDNTSIPLRPYEPSTPLVSAFPTPSITKPVDNRNPGSVVSVADPTEAVDGDLLAVGATVKRIVYRSTSGIDDSPTLVSGIAVIPNGPPPNGGWPVVAYGHPSSGVKPVCAPSLFSSMLGNAGVLAALVVGGYAVVMSDYQGLGQPGYVHPFLDSKTYGNNMIDAVRAIRAIAPENVSTQWVAYGSSLGGLAAWAAADRATAYGQGLTLLGTAAISPFADMTELVDRAVDGTMTRDQYPLYIYLLQTMSQTYPSMRLDDYRSPFARSVWATALECLPSARTSPDDIVRALTSLGPDDLRPASPAAAAFVRSKLAERALPIGTNPAPTLVTYGTDDQSSPPQWTERAIARSCANGQKLDVIKRVGETSAELDAGQSVAFINTVRTSGWTFTNCEQRP